VDWELLNISGKLHLCGIVEACGENVGFRLSRRGICAPTSGGLPFAVRSGCVAVD
jgi:hypothetical protein